MAGRQNRVGQFPLSINGRALAHGISAGLAKVIVYAVSGALLGAP